MEHVISPKGKVRRSIPHLYKSFGWRKGSIPHLEPSCGRKMRMGGKVSQSGYKRISDNIMGYGYEKKKKKSISHDIMRRVNTA